MSSEASVILSTGVGVVSIQESVQESGYPLILSSTIAVGTYPTGMHSCFFLIFAFLRCLLEDWCVGCATTRDDRYAIIHRRGTEEQKQTLASDTDGAIYIGKRSHVIIFIYNK